MGNRAFRPDCVVYASEIAPARHGLIGVFDGHHPGARTRVVDFRQHLDGEFTNDLKALAWSPDGRLLAAMFHEAIPGQSQGGHIEVRQVDTGEVVKTVLLSRWYHDLRFSSNGTRLVAEGDEVGEIS